MDDGSGEAHVYVEGDLLRELLMVSLSNWTHLCELVWSVGTVTYTKPIRQAPTQVISMQVVNPYTLYTTTLLRNELPLSLLDSFVPVSS